MSDEIERLRAEVAALREQYEGIEEERNAMDAIESERDALLARIENSPRATMDASCDGLGLCAMVKEDFPLLYAIRGKRVALVVLE